MIGQDIIIILSLILIEGLLSIDNAAVLATMVKHLPEGQRHKALRYGIIGAYLFRGIALFTAVYLIKFAWIKLLGGAYLLWLCYSFFFGKKEEHETTKTTSIMKGFWGTVATVEMMDMVFSIDNVLAAVAFTSNIWLILTGVFIGILAMRFVAGIFVNLMTKYPELESCAYIVIGILGFKLILSFLGFFEGETASVITSGLTILIFSFPFIKKRFLSNGQS